MKHIPTRCFSRSIDLDERYQIITEYEGGEWEYVKQFISEIQQITSSAVRIKEVINKHFGIKLFPTVVTVATKGWGASGGTVNFCMYGEWGKCYLFYSAAKDFKAMKGKYSLDEYGFYRD